MNADAFAACRPRLLGIAYGLLGELSEAEDVVQDAWLRWERVDRDAIRNAEPFLVTVTTRIALDRLRSARARREATPTAGESSPQPASPSTAPPRSPAFSSASSASPSSRTTPSTRRSWSMATLAYAWTAPAGASSASLR
ncbi:MAG TPA: sigma factor [Solirubrobacterales bacterium]|nr:sigma factor [Solirubrobacterales bacterium]